MNAAAPATRVAVGLLVWGSGLGIALAAVDAAAHGGQAPGPEAVCLRLNPNTASAVELTLLPGIGPATIEQIQGFLRFEDSPTRVEEPSP
jgi:hypothetical protein